MREEVLLAVVGLLLLAAYVASFPAPRGATSLRSELYLKYASRAYGAEWLPGAAGAPPRSGWASGVPWISHQRQYCASTCLQMAAYKFGVEESIGYFNFAMGFTYGAFYMKAGGFAAFIPGSDPLSGFRNASRLIGLEHRMLVTDSRESFLAACKHFLARGIPVITPVNAARLHGKPGFSPHFELLAGYEGEDFYFYEPVGEERFLEPGARGVRVSGSALAEAAREYSEAFQHPWRYALIVFEGKTRSSETMEEALARIGSLQVGANMSFWGQKMLTGHYALLALAGDLKPGRVAEPIAWGLRMARDYRADDAKFLESIGQRCASRYLEEASELYGSIASMLSDELLTEREAAMAKSMLVRAAKLEKAAGAELLAASKGSACLGLP